MVTALIVAAGSSRRMGFDKLFAPLDGKPVLAHSILAFERSRSINEILLVAHPERMDPMKDLVRDLKAKKVREIIPGGEERHLSVWNGLQAVSAKAGYVAVHDGARPLVTSALINGCLKLARDDGAACCATPIPDTVKRASADDIVSESVDRSGLWAMQTPQMFSTAILLQVYASLIANREPVTDEVSAVQKMGKKIALLRNNDWNFKITFPHDLEMAAHVLALRSRRKP